MVVPALSGCPGQARARRVRELSVMPMLRTPRGAAARVAFHAGAVAKQSEVAAFAAGFALVALGARFGALLGRGLLGVGLGVGPVEGVELLRGRELGFGLELERGCAGGFGAV